jgi:hypothetical protein
VIGASDRMLTGGDIEFEPEQAKIWQLSQSIFGLVSGDLSIQAEIMKRVHQETQRRIVAAPDVWLSVKEVGTLYCHEYRHLLKEMAEAEILSPIGLDLTSFLTKQRTMQRELVSNIADRLASYAFPSELAMIFFGVDVDGQVGLHGEALIYPQIYVAEEDKLSCFTTVGFAAIGIGKSHGESQFMFSGHWPNKPFAESLLLAYAAKKRAEVAPGVGKQTDMVIVGPGLGIHEVVSREHLGELHKIYEKSRRASDAIIKKARTEANQFVNKVRRERAKKKADGSQIAADKQKPKLEIDAKN